MHRTGVKLELPDTARDTWNKGRLDYEVIKNVASGEVVFRVAGYSRAAPIHGPISRLGFGLFGRVRVGRSRSYSNFLGCRPETSEVREAVPEGGDLPLVGVQGDRGFRQWHRRAASRDRRSPSGLAGRARLGSPTTARSQFLAKFVERDGLPALHLASPLFTMTC